MSKTIAQAMMMRLIRLTWKSFTKAKIFPFYSLRSRRHLFSVAAARFVPAISGISSNTCPSLLCIFSNSSSLLSTTSTAPQQHSNGGSDTEVEDERAIVPSKLLNPQVTRDLDTVLSSLKDFNVDTAKAKRQLENCHVSPTAELVDEALFRLRHDWSAAYTFFLWASDNASSSYDHAPRAYHSVLATLARARRFDTAWSLVADMRCRSILAPQSLLILLRRYAALHDVAGAINTFHAYKNFGFIPAIDDFQALLAALCRYKNVEDAEHLLMCNEKSFPFETKSFNIVLNGWCNVLVRVGDAKRFWIEMDRRGITKDVISYGCMISCYSKAGNLNDVLKLYNRMKEAGIVPDVKVYNAVIYALAKGNCVNDAKKLLKTMEEKGIAPNAVTFNSLIRPLCKARKIDDAWLMFDEMQKRGLVPSIRTYHAFFGVLRNTDEVFELLNHMKKARCSPVTDTYIMLIRKLSRWKQHGGVLKLWDEMKEKGLGPDRSSYIVLIHGLFLNGKLEEAGKYYVEMKGKGFEPEPKTDEMIQTWLSGRGLSGIAIKNETSNPLEVKKLSDANSLSRRRTINKHAEGRSVTRKRGYSLW